MNTLSKYELFIVEDNLNLISKAQEGVEVGYFISLQKHSGFAV
ncbi:MAG: hypothetical protein WD426_09865 [Anditalea sp.]